MLQDFRYALRTIRQAPAFSVVVTLTIALGVGTTTAIFSVVDAVLLRPLAYPAQTSLVKLFDSQSGRDVGALSFPEFVDWRDRGSEVFESVGAYGARGEVLSGAGEAEQLLGVQASLEVAALLGLRPIFGRGFVETDELPGGPHVVVLSEHLWRVRFGADPAIVGRTISLTGVSYQVIGVFPSTASAILPSPVRHGSRQAGGFLGAASARPEDRAARSASAGRNRAAPVRRDVGPGGQPR